MKTLLITLLLGLLTACSSVQDTGGRSLATVAVTVDSTMKAWAIYCSTHDVKATEHDKIRVVYQRYQLAMVTAENAYTAAMATKDAGLMKQSLAVLNATKDDLVAIVKLLSGNNVVN